MSGHPQIATDQGIWRQNFAASLCDQDHVLAAVLARDLPERIATMVVEERLDRQDRPGLKVA